MTTVKAHGLDEPDMVRNGLAASGLRITVA